MIGFLALMGASYHVARTAGKWITETARTIRSYFHRDKS
jgi:hypothetical protein